MANRATLADNARNEFARDALSGVSDHELAVKYGLTDRTATNWRVRLAGHRQKAHLSSQWLSDPKVEDARREVDRQGPITRADSRTVIKEKLRKLWELSDAAISGGMETWDLDRTNLEVSRMRGRG